MLMRGAYSAPLSTDMQRILNGKQQPSRCSRSMGKTMIFPDPVRTRSMSMQEPQRRIPEQLNNLAFFTAHDGMTSVANEGVTASVGQSNLSGCSYINAKGFYACATGQGQQAPGENTNQHGQRLYDIWRTWI